jgi:aspartate 1-decarboxylase
MDVVSGKETAGSIGVKEELMNRSKIKKQERVEVDEV